MRSSTHVSYLLTVARVNAGRFRERAGAVQDPRIRLVRDQKAGNLGSLLSVFILSFTVVTALVLGILAAYGSVIGILHSFANRSSQPQDQKPVLVQARAAHAGGD